MSTVILNIGSNLGDRRLNLSRAMSALNAEFGDFELSHAVESEPWGFESKNTFLNIGMLFMSDLEPLEILHRIKAIEKRLSPAPHRNADGSYADRAVDIDIVAIDEMVMDTPELKLPHPHLAEREFFLVPLEELAPMWRHPLTGRNATEMIRSL